MKTENKVETLQQLINKKAELRLKADLKNLEDLINSNKLLTGRFEDCDYAPKLSLLMPKKDTNGNMVYQTDSLDRLLNSNWGVLKNEMWENYLPIYINQETVSFVNKVSQLENQIYDLKNSIPNDDY